jgi:hypothetical protein
MCDYSWTEGPGVGLKYLLITEGALGDLLPDLFTLEQR